MTYNNGMESPLRKILTPLILLGLVFAVGSIGRQLLLGGSRPVSLSSAPALSGLVAQSLTSSGDSQPPLAGKDFELKNERHFGNDWVVLEIAPLQNKSNAGLVVLQKISGTYEVVLGPGTSFDSSYLLSVPSDVAAYLSAKGVTYDAVN